jgi:squalene synthase HpnC
MSAAWLVTELRQYGPDSPPRPRPSVRQARRYCRRIARGHYENFLVASLALPRRMRDHFFSIYAFCRWADNLADEAGDSARSLELLQWWERLLGECYAGRPTHPVLVALADTIREFAIPADPFHRLLEAFRQDQRVTRYQRFDDLLGYCRHSANPVGELVLYVARCHEPSRVALSDQVCTGLQLANFWQDLAGDYRRGRIYLPREDMDRYGCTERDLAADSTAPALRRLLAFEVDRAARYLRQGRPLCSRVPAWLRVDLEMFIRGGEAVVQAIRDLDYDVLRRRPTVRRVRQIRLLAATWLRRWWVR